MWREAASPRLRLASSTETGKRSYGGAIQIIDEAAPSILRHLHLRISSGSRYCSHHSVVTVLLVYLIQTRLVRTTSHFSVSRQRNKKSIDSLANHETIRSIPPTGTAVSDYEHGSWAHSVRRTTFASPGRTFWSLDRRLTSARLGKRPYKPSSGTLATRNPLTGRRDSGKQRPAPDRAKWRCKPVTVTLREICRYQKSDLLILRTPFYRVSGIDGPTRSYRGIPCQSRSQCESLRNSCEARDYLAEGYTDCATTASFLRGSSLNVGQWFNQGVVNSLAWACSASRNERLNQWLG
ncbi:hypothetical protein HBH56_232150 [Parastagonospora nodorum]|nr:hypothetical protein HBH56_232150 [Parastagonospora nodorum]KAH3921463.1 hypothetical protein HBH54_240930 [Parastagonospora nodorum]KAH4125400.1 hypothetical protein HBH45_232040 [Parastagonospora nodorum]KAH4147738.1 hypothetical protein HBH44_219220 [Parastagonospora nodorum]KAH4555791.1 hypothetical protein HBH84_236750 [Parastagonospora nodorum]